MTDQNDMLSELRRRCLVIAEVSANHGGSLSRALEMIRVAHDCGAGAVKFQAYTPDTLTIDADNEYFRIDHAHWGGQTLYQLYQQAYTPLEWLEELKQAADELGIIFLCTAFDQSGVDLLERLDVAAHKIASFELVDLELVKYAAATSKPLILSTGMADLDEIQDAVTSARQAGANDITLLKCTSSYPADPDEMNLRTLQHMRESFQCEVGLSDHSEGITAALCAVALGASMVEKHFTLADGPETPDSFFSLRPEQLKALVDGINVAERAAGSVRYGMTEHEKANRIFRRSLFVVKDVKTGQRFDRNNIRSIRPGYGLKPKYLEEIIGRKSRCDIPCGSPLSWDMVE